MHLKKTHCNQSPEFSCDPFILARAGTVRGIWHETEAEIQTRLDAGAEKALLLHWVRREMGRRLTPRERRYLELHYFDANTLEEVARRTGVNRSTVARALQRAVRKLRRAARENAGDSVEDRAVVRAIKNRTR